MAVRTVTILEDDLDGKEDATVETVTFSFEGASYEIDLSKKNRDAFEKALTPYLNAARKAPKATTARRSPAKSSEDLDAIRAWAKDNGHEVADRGRIAQSVKDAYYASNVKRSGSLK